MEAIHQRGRLTARERLTALFDAASFVEYGGLAGATTDPEDEAHADGLVAGVGLVHGEPVVGASYDESVLGGTQSDRNQRKMAKLLYLAVEHRWPFVCFVDGGGARLDDPLPPPPIAVTPRGRFELYDGLAELNGWAPTLAIASGRVIDGHAGIAMLTPETVHYGRAQAVLERRQRTLSAAWRRHPERFVGGEPEHEPLGAPIANAPSRLGP